MSHVNILNIMSNDVLILKLEQIACVHKNYDAEHQISLVVEFSLLIKTLEV